METEIRSEEVHVDAQPAPAKKPRPSKKPAPAKKPSDGQVAMLQELARLPLPSLATGGSLITWKNDLTGVSEIAISRTPDKPESWIIVHGDKAVKVPEGQYRAFCFTAMAFTASPRTDRGAAYSAWVNMHAKILQKYFAEYTFRIIYNKSSIPLLQYGLMDVVKLSSIIAPIVKASLLLKQPTRTTRTRKEKEDTYELVII